ncbi:MAG TPA: C1 family peptidase [Bacteroidales bacterium]|nr:C1 family peptidase [Bacteroidales bacterium]HPP92418.1 C1 family peptidase [Bacteroidales bacterium]HRR15742.1 C1 family peptidase [Bacteroidales bacterium]HRT47269.1 C1 family peptidase [Bacteroidales bacterium]HRU56211.1 C1 family peptidase [Bacteroidales bacterium]
MKRVFMILIILMGGIFLFAQPADFRWDKRHQDRYKPDSLTNYISDAKNQKEQGPCGAFAAVAAVEAIAQIYFNKTGPMLDLSESNIYSGIDTSMNCKGVGCGAVGVISSLFFIKNNGIVDENCFRYPDQPLPPHKGDSTYRYCYEDCQIMCDNPDYRVFIPYYDDTANINNNTELKQAIMDYGPIIVEFANGLIGCRLHPDDPNCNNPHSLLFIGWETKSGNLWWRFKDSWPNKESIKSDTLNIFNYRPTFIRVYPVYNGDTIRCQGSYCTLFNSRKCEDKDKDGFYNWGFDTQPKPSGCPGPDKMDFNDRDSSIIFRVGYEPLPAPQLTGPSYVCSQQRTFTLHNVPSLFLEHPDSIEWEVTPSVYFDTPRSGKGDTVVNINPYPGYIGKQGEIKFTLRHNGKVEYKHNFTITGPREDLVSISVIDSYGGSPPKYGDIYYICPNTIYHIYYNNYDSNCSTWDYDWVLPYGWTEYWRYGNMISVNTNDYPYGLLEVWGKTCCENQSRIKLKTQYFYEYYECGEYFMAFPNPANSYVDIDINREKMAEENIRTDAKCTLTLYDKTGLVKYKTEFRGFPFRIETVNLPEGVYLMNLLYNGRTYSMSVVIKH